MYVYIFLKFAWMNERTSICFFRFNTHLSEQVILFKHIFKYVSRRSKSIILFSSSVMPKKKTELSHETTYLNKFLNQVQWIYFKKIIMQNDLIIIFSVISYLFTPRFRFIMNKYFLFLYNRSKKILWLMGFYDDKIKLPIKNFKAKFNLEHSKKHVTSSKFICWLATTFKIFCYWQLRIRCNLMNEKKV